MKLAKAANYFDKEQFSVYDSKNKVWDYQEISGRLLPVDRFLSNFSRPLHRRMLVCDVDTVIPASGTIRSEATQEIYIVGQGRFDAYSNNPYQALYMAHMVTGKAGGLATVTRREAVGPVSDPGHLVTRIVGEFYMDVELRGATPEEGTEHLMAGQYFLMAPPECELQEWDYVELNGKNYRVEEDYFDSGLTFSRVIQTEDDRVDLVYVSTTAFAYDSASGTATETTVPYNVTGSVLGYKTVSADSNQVSENTFKVVIPTENIGFEPKPRETITIDSSTHVILQVSRDPLTSEWVLVCQA